MKKTVRKNQIVITALVVMVALAGYLSLTEKEELAVTTSNQSVEDAAVADISDEDIVLDGDGNLNGVSSSAVSGSAGSEAVINTNVASKENAGEAVLVSTTVAGNYFDEAKLSREQTRAKNKETLTGIVNNANVSAEKKDKAMNEIMKMTTISEKETATENMLAAKGFSEAIVTISDESVDVVINAENLTEQQIAQIADIVKRKTECDPGQIVISPVGKKE